MKKKIMSLLMALCFAMVTCVTAAATDVTTFSGAASREEDTVTVVLSVDKAGATSGQMQLAYDAEALELVSAEFGAAIAGLVETGDPNSINTAEAGVVAAGFASLTATEAGEVLVVTFNAKGETPAEGYRFPVTYTEWSTEGKNSLLNGAAGAEDVIVLEGEKPVEPENPGSDSSTTQPEQPGTDSSDTKPEEDKGNTGAGSQTGDTAPVAALVVLLVVAVAGIAAVLVVRKKHTDK